MKGASLLTAGIFTMALVSPVMAADAPLSAEQKKQVEQIVHDYLVQNPEVLIEVSQVLQQKQQQTMQSQAKAAISENASQLFSGKLGVVGNAKGNVSMVEFFDYQCIHCKKMSPVINKLLQSDKNLRVIYKEFPIFGKTSEMASRAALAAAMQGKYDALHNALLKIEKHLDEALILNTAKSVGLNMTQLKTDMGSQTVTNILDENRKLAEKLHLMGTPAFIVASTPKGQLKEGTTPAFIPGAASEEALQDLIKKAAEG